MKFKPTAFSLLIISVLASVLAVSAYASTELFADTGIRLGPNHVVVVNDFRVPDLPPWWSVGEVREGSKLGFKLDDNEFLIVEGISGKNALPPWNGYSVIKAVITSRSVLGWLPASEIASMPVEQGKTYVVKAWLEGGEIKVVVCTSIRCEFLASYEVGNDLIEVWAEGCTPHLESMVQGPNPMKPIPMTQSDLLKYLLIGAGVITVAMIVLPLMRR